MKSLLARIQNGAHVKNVAAMTKGATKAVAVPFCDISSSVGHTRYIEFTCIPTAEKSTTRRRADSR